MEFEKSVQSALKTLRASLAQHEAHREGYERTIARLIELQKNVPRQSKVNSVNGQSLMTAPAGRNSRYSPSDASNR